MTGSLRTSVLVTVLYAAGGCSTSSGSSSPAPQTPPVSGPVGANTPTGPLVSASLSLKLVLAGATLPAASSLTSGLPSATYADVSPIFSSHCASCHNPQGRSPDLSNYPFSAPGETLTQILQDVGGKVAMQQMPPNGALALADQETIGAWLAGGAPGPSNPVTTAQPAPPTSAAQPEPTPVATDLSTYQVSVQWAPSGSPVTSTWMHLAPSANGTYAVSLGILPSGSNLAVHVQVIAPTGQTALDQTYTPLMVAATGAVSLTATANAPSPPAASPPQPAVFAPGP